MWTRLKNSNSFLSNAGAALDRSELQWINSFACRIYSNMFVPLLKHGIRAEKVFLRRSALTPRDFNLLFSDLDIGLVINGKSDLKMVRDNYLRFKRVFPFLGEMEIYENNEVEEINELMVDNQKVYSFFRDLRKIGWMEKKYCASNNPYERHKALRAIKKSLTRLGSSLEPLGFGNLKDINRILTQFFEREFPAELAYAQKIETDMKVNITCPYFARRFIFSPRERGGPETRDISILRLRSGLALLLLAIAPPMTREKGQLDGTLAKLRERPKVKAQLSALTRMELLIFKGVFRAMENPNDLDRSWMNCLIQSDALTR